MACSAQEELKDVLEMLLLINKVRMIFLKTDDEIELLRQSNLLVGRTLAESGKIDKAWSDNKTT